MVHSHILLVVAHPLMLSNLYNVPWNKFQIPYNPMKYRYSHQLKLKREVDIQTAFWF